MSSFDTTRSTPSRTAPAFSGLFGNLVSAFNAWNDARITHKTLSKLSARELDDIGLTFGSIDEVSRRTSR